MVVKKNTVKSFAGSAKKNREPIKLEIAGIEIEALSTVSGMITLEFLEGISSDESRDNLSAVRLYLNHSFDKENKKKFLDVVDDIENGIELSDLTEIMSWLVEERAGGKDLEESSES